MPVVTVDWGARSERLRALHGSLNGGQKSFLLVKAPTPVAIGTLTAAQLPGWETATPAPLTVTPVAGTYTATAAVPDTATHVRLDFELKVTIGSATASCLAFRQLFAVGAGGALLPAQYSFEDRAFILGGGSGGAVAPAPLAPPRRRVVLGASPLLAVTTTTVTVNCEFLDVTELWWAAWATSEIWGWYLDPAFHGRPDLLRVLAWTSGNAPMLWFVALSQKALDGVGSAPRTGADVVFFRAQAGFNSFRYSSDEKGFLAAKHGDTTMYHLGRWLLSPLPEAETAALIARTGGAPKPSGVKYAGIRLRPDTMPPAISPAEPMDAVHADVRRAFRPSCVQDALDHSPNADVAFLPLGFDAAAPPDPYTSGGGYTALLKRGALRETMNSARALLWMRGALSRSETATPTFDRQIWLLANSAANGQLFGCLTANPADVDRIISLDATKAVELLIPAGIPAIQAVSASRRKAGKAFKAVVVTTPNMWADKAAYLDIERQVLATKADVTMLPPKGEFDAYWAYPPTATSNPMLFEALRFWDGNGLAGSHRMGTVAKGFQWLWWHEWSVDGGHFEAVPAGTSGGAGVPGGSGAPGAPGAGASTAGPPTAPPVRVRTFFEDALML